MAAPEPTAVRFEHRRNAKASESVNNVVDVIASAGHGPGSFGGQGGGGVDDQINR